MKVISDGLKIIPPWLGLRYHQPEMLSPGVSWWWMAGVAYWRLLWGIQSHDGVVVVTFHILLPGSRAVSRQYKPWCHKDNDKNLSHPFCNHRICGLAKRCIMLNYNFFRITRRHGSAGDNDSEPRPSLRVSWCHLGHNSSRSQDNPQIETGAVLIYKSPSCVILFRVKISSRCLLLNLERYQSLIFPLVSLRHSALCSFPCSPNLVFPSNSCFTASITGATLGKCLHKIKSLSREGISCFSLLWLLWVKLKCYQDWELSTITDVSWYLQPLEFPYNPGTRRQNNSIHNRHNNVISIQTREQDTNIFWEHNWNISHLKCQQSF